MSTISSKILMVDDEANVLAGYMRVLHGKFEICTAKSGEEGLAFVEKAGPFAVVVADMRMPRMNGVEFLRRVRQVAPQTVRMMLTGNADMDTAVEAVNQGHIFRFLTKPCQTDTLCTVLLTGLEQYRLVRAERELLENTLQGCVRVLVEILETVNPLAFSQATRLRHYIKHMAAELEPGQTWQFALAAMLSQIGCVTLPPALVERAFGGDLSEPDERRAFESHPATGARLLANIPRFEAIAAMIAGQQQPYRFYGTGQGNEAPQAAVINLGAQMLKAALEYDHLIMHGAVHAVAIEELAKRPEEYNPRVVLALASLQVSQGKPEREPRVQSLKVKDLKPGMIVQADVLSANGSLLLPKGRTITNLTLLRLENYAHLVGLQEPIPVQLPEVMDQ